MARKATSNLGIVASVQDKASGPILKLASSVTNAGGAVTKANAAMEASNNKLLASINRTGQTSLSLEKLSKGYRMISHAVSGAWNMAERWTKAAIAAEGTSSVFGEKVKLLAAAQNDLAVAIGSGVTHSAAAREGLDALTTAAEDFAAVFRSEEGRTAIDGFFRSLNTLAADTIDAFLGMKTLSRDLGAEWTRLWVKMTGEPVFEALDENAGKADEALQNLADRLRGIGAAGPKTIALDVGPSISDAQLKKNAAEQQKAAERARELLAQRRAEEQRYIEWRDGAFTKLAEELATAEEAATERGRQQAIARLDYERTIAEARRAIDEGNAARREAQADRIAAIEEQKLIDTEATARSVGATIVGAMSATLKQVADGTASAGEAIGGMFLGFGEMILEYVAQLGAAWVVEQGILYAKQALGIETAAVVAGASVTGKAVETTAAVTTAETEIAAATAAGSAEAIAAHAGIPFVGIAIGLAAAAAIAGAIAAVATGFADGGWVSGGTPGRDSVPALLMPGEYVETVDEARALRGPARSRGTHSPISAGGGGGGDTYVITSAFPQSRAEIERFSRDNVGPGLARRRRRF